MEGAVNRDPEVVEMLRRIERLKMDLTRMRIIDNYPVIRRILENPTPSDWGAFAGYLRLAKKSDMIDPRIREKIAELEKVYVDAINRRLSEVGGCWVAVDENGDSWLNYYEDGTVKTVKLGFVDVWSIMASRNLDEIVPLIVKKGEVGDENG